MEKFKGFYIDYMPQKDNTHVDTLTSLTATLELSPKVQQKVFGFQSKLVPSKISFGNE